MNEFITPTPKPVKAALHTERTGRVDIEGSLMHGLETIFGMLDDAMERDAALSRLRKLHYTLNQQARRESLTVIQQQTLRQAA